MPDWRVLVSCPALRHSGTWTTHAHTCPPSLSPSVTAIGPCACAAPTRQAVSRWPCWSAHLHPHLCPNRAVHTRTMMRLCACVRACHHMQTAVALSWQQHYLWRLARHAFAGWRGHCRSRRRDACSRCSRRARLRGLGFADEAAVYRQGLVQRALLAWCACWLRPRRCGVRLEGGGVRGCEGAVMGLGLPGGASQSHEYHRVDCMSVGRHGRGSLKARTAQPCSRGDGDAMLWWHGGMHGRHERPQ